MALSPDSPPNPSTIHQFLISNPISSQTQYESPHFDGYGVDLRNLGTYPQSLGVLPSIQDLGERMSRSIDLVHAPPMAEEQETLSHQHQRERLSLSLGSGLLVPSSAQYRERCLTSNITNQPYLVSEEETRKAFSTPGDYSFAGIAASLNQSCSGFYAAESLAVAVGSSRYLKPAQFLLEEVVSVGGKEIELSNESYARKLSRSGKRGSLTLCSELKAEFCNSNGSSMEKQELQAKIAKLIALLEEVERRYEQYYQHLEEVVSSFEVVAGLGTGKSYTALALHAMSGHFCSLRDAILSQIHATRKKILQDMLRTNTGFSQLSLFDGETRQNRVALQQLGMIASPRQTWRPIRGLPETSVMILRSWLFEHFLHPYPNDNEKLMLASQTGLSKNQVSNWFINARVRLWKPMIEEMYKEEFAEDLSEDSNVSPGSNCITTRKEIKEHAEE